MISTLNMGDYMGPNLFKRQWSYGGEYIFSIKVLLNKNYKKYLEITISIHVEFKIFNNVSSWSCITISPLHKYIFKCFIRKVRNTTHRFGKQS